MDGQITGANIRKLNGLNEGGANINNLLDLGSDASNSGRFKAMDDEEEKEKQRKIKINRGMRS
jgi:hypothetical protein